MNSTLTLKNHSLVQTIVVKKESMILGPKTESLNDSCINHDFAFSSSQIEQNYLISSQNITTNQNMDNDSSLESVNQDCPMKRGTSNFQHLESYHALYPDLFTDYSSCHDTNMQTNSPLWPTPILMRSDLLYKDEENLSIQDIEDENNFMNIAHESHAYDNIKESRLKDQIISHNILDFGDTNLFNCKLINSSKYHEFQRESPHSQVMLKSDFQFNDNDVSLQKYALYFNYS